MLQLINLSPILANPPAAEILLLARGQLNRAFRRHGLAPPDPLTLNYCASIDPKDLDDPAAQGIDHAMARFHEDFILWAGAMPTKLVPPVLDILRQARQALDPLSDDSNTATVALREAYEFLSGCLHSTQDCSDGT